MPRKLVYNCRNMSQEKLVLSVLGRSNEIYPPKERRNVVSDINMAQAYTELMRAGIKEKYGIGDSEVTLASQLLTTMDKGAWVTASSLWRLGHDQQVAANFAQMAKTGKWNVMGVKPDRYEEYLGDVFHMTVVSEQVRMAKPRGIVPDPEIVKTVKARLIGEDSPEVVTSPQLSGDDDFGKYLDSILEN